MNCRTAGKHIQERLDEPLLALLETELQTHLGDCARCAGEARAYELTSRWVQELPEASLSENFDWRLRLRISQEEKAGSEVGNADLSSSVPPSGPIHSWKWQFGAMAAAVAALVFGLGWSTLRQPGDLDGRQVVGKQTGESPSAGTSTVAESPEVNPAEAPTVVRALPNLGWRNASWFKLTPVSSGTPIGPERNYRPAPSILGEPSQLRVQP